MRKFLRKLRQLCVNAVLLITTTGAVASILIPSTPIFRTILWVGSTVLLLSIWFLFSKKRKFSDKLYKDQQGYIVFRSNQEYLHRYIAKKVLKRRLFPNEIVHHINGKRDDNRWSNLCVMDRHQHELIHAWLDWKKKKTGKYPHPQEQKKVLEEKHNGILLEKYLPSAKRKFSSTPVRHKFVIRKSQTEIPNKKNSVS